MRDVRSTNLPEVSASLFAARTKAMLFLDTAISTRRLHHFVMACVCILPFCWFFGPALLSTQTFAFRDGAHFYHPLFEWTRNEWLAGRVPLWNPQENCGVPVLADATASVFYPGTLLFFLPLPYVTTFNLFVSAHVILALWTTFVLARAWRATPLASVFAAISYTFGGKVLFEHSNVIFLISAAWLPLALLAMDRLISTRQWRWAATLGAVQAMMILGGDPQMAYHTILIAGVFFLLAVRAERISKPGRNSVEPRPSASLSVSRWPTLRSNRGLLFLSAFVFAALLAAVQILPARIWTTVSDRAAFESPRNVFEAARWWHENDQLSVTEKTNIVAHGILGQPDAGHHRFLYRFSIGPWRLPELFWPNVFGRWLPENHRWLGVLLAEDFVWTPSLYMGLLPLLLSLRSWSIRGQEPRWACISWMVLFGIVGAFGEWGLGSLIEFAQYAATGERVVDPVVGRPVGGLYWLLVTFLPTYAYFRFPAKLWTLAALGISLLAARGFDRLFEKQPQIQLQRWLGFLGRQSFVGLVVILVLIPWWAKCMRYVPKESLMGAINVDAAWWDVFGAFSHTLIICAVLWWICAHPTSVNAWRLRPCFALLLTMFDITAANHWLVQTTDEKSVRQTPQAVRAMQADVNTHNSVNVENTSLEETRVYRGVDWSPHHWWESTSPTRLEDTFRWRHNTLYPKYHLRNDVAFVESQGTLASVDLQQLLEIAREHGVPRSDGAKDPPPAVLRALSTRYLVLPDHVQYPEAIRIDDALTPPQSIESTAVWRLNNPAPRSWIVRDVAVLPPISTRSLKQLRQRTEEVLFPQGDGNIRDFTRSAVVETNDEITFFRATLRGSNFDGAIQTPVNNGSETCKLIRETPQYTELAVEMHSAGLVVFNDLYYSGWIATATTLETGETRRVPIHRTNRIMRGVVLPAGTHRLVFQYQPPEFLAGAMVSSLSWITLGLFGTGLYALRKNAFWRKKRETDAGSSSQVPAFVTSSGYQI